MLQRFLYKESLSRLSKSIKKRLKDVIEDNYNSAKGRLFDDSKNLLIRSGVNFSTSGEKLLARSSNLDIDILLVRDDDIPSLVSKGANLGIVGQNVLAEQVAQTKKLLLKLF